MAKTELRKDNGDVFLEIERQPDNSYVFANWIGLQSVETVQEGGKIMLEMMHERPYLKLLNSNKEVVGPWNTANDWVANTWTPQMQAAGLRYLAQVLGPGIYAQMTFKDLYQRIDDVFEIKMFDTNQDAMAWLDAQP